MDNKKLVAGALGLLLVGALLGRSLSGGSKADFDKGRVAGCNALGQAASGGLLSCALKNGQLRVLAQGEEVANLDAPEQR